jgi:L-glyceraldehyde 3-phosphate reductase
MSYCANPNRYEQANFARCGNSGLLLPRISLGLWHNFGETTDKQQSRDILTTAFDSGITHFDLANNYGPPPGSAETRFGEILVSDLASYRDELVISTKAGHLMWPGPYGDWGSRKHMLASLDQSLKRMRLDYVDIFYAHRFDPNTPLEETAGALISAVRQGKALYAGISKFPEEAARTIYKYLREAGVPCLIHQFRYNILDRSAETVQFPAIRDEHIGGIAFSPLGQGLLSNRYLHGIPEDSRACGHSVFLTQERVLSQLAIVQELAKIAEQRGQSLAQMALAWVLIHPEVTSCLIGASKVEQIKDCLKALQSPRFSDTELRAIDEAVGIIR